MAVKTIELDEEILQFALERCTADIALGLNGAEQFTLRLDPKRAKKMMDYVVLVRRLKASLEKAR